MSRIGLAWCVVGLLACGRNDPFPPHDAGSVDAGDLDAGRSPDDPCSAAGGGADRDGDGVLDACDACPDVFDPEQLDADYDGVGNACAPPPAGACGANGVCWEWPRPQVQSVSFAAARGEELWLVDDWRIWHFDGTRWALIPMPMHYAVSVTVTAESLWLQEEVDSDRGPTAPLWRRRHMAGTWESIVELPYDHRATVLDDEHVWWSVGGDRLGFFDGQAISETTADELQRSGYRGLPESEFWRLATPLRSFDGQRWVDDPSGPCGTFSWPERWLPTADGGFALCWFPGGPELVQRVPPGWLRHGPAPAPMFAQLWGTGADDLWLVDANFPTLHRFTSPGWSRELAPVLGRIVPLSQTSASRHWAVSQGGDVLRKDGHEWKAVARTGTTVLSVSGGASGEAWVAGNNGLLAQRQNGLWHRVAWGGDEDLYSVAAKGDDVWIAAGRDAGVRHRHRGHWAPVRYQGQSFEAHDVLALPDSTWFFNVFSFRLDGHTGAWLEPSLAPVYSTTGESEENLWGTHNDQLVRWTGAEWELDPSAGHRPTAFDARHGEVWALHGTTDADATIRRRTASGWTEKPLGIGAAGTGLVVRAPGEAYVADRTGRVSLVHADPSKATTFVRGNCHLVRVGDGAECLSPFGLASVHAPARIPERLVAAGGRVLRFDGHGWAPIGAPGLDAWTDGERALVLRDGALWQYESKLWSEVVRLAAGTWRAIWSEGGATLVAGEDASGATTVVRVDGAQSSALPGGLDAVRDLAGHSGELYTAHRGGRIARWDGHAWHDAGDAPFVTAGADVRLAAGGGALWAVGQGTGGLRVVRRESDAWLEVETPAAWTLLGGAWTDGEGLWIPVAIGGTPHAAHWNVGGWRTFALPVLAAYDVGGVGAGASRRVFVAGDDEVVRLP